MKTSKPEAQALIAQLKETKVGGFLPLPSILPGIDKTETQAFLRERQDNYWVLDLRWNGILYAEVTAQVLEGKLLLEVL